jgi:hypothetical protein
MAVPAPGGLAGCSGLGLRGELAPATASIATPSWLNPAFQQACARKLIRNSTDALVLQMPYSEIRV